MSTSAGERVIFEEPFGDQLQAVRDTLGFDLSEQVTEQLIRTWEPERSEGLAFDRTASAYNAFWWTQAVKKAAERGDDPRDIDLFYDDPHIPGEVPFNGQPLHENIDIGRAVMGGNYEEFINRMTDAFVVNGVAELHRDNGLVVMTNHMGYHALGKLTHGLGMALTSIREDSEPDPRQDMYTVIGPSVLTKAPRGSLPLATTLLGASGYIRTIPPTENARMPGLKVLGAKMSLSATRSISKHRKTPGHTVIVSPTGTNDVNGQPGDAITHEGLATALKVCAPRKETILVGVSLYGDDDDPFVGVAVSEPVHLSEHGLRKRADARESAAAMFDAVYGDLLEEAREMHDVAVSQAAHDA